MPDQARIYLDHAATTPIIPAAREEMADAMARWANPSSPHSEGRASRAALTRKPCFSRKRESRSRISRSSSMIRICGAFSMPCYISLPEAAFIGQCCETCLTRRLLPFVALCHVGRLLPAIFDRHVHKYRNGARPAPKLPWGCSGDAPRHLRRGASWLRSRLGGKASS